MPFEPSKTAVEEGCGVFLALAWQQLGVGQARAAIDGDVQVFPAEALPYRPAVALTGVDAGVELLRTAV